MEATKLSYTTCPLCEATCGLEIGTHGSEVISIKGDKQDVFSSGYICPKAYSLKELHTDGDRLREPMVRRGEDWQVVSWDEAFAGIEQRLLPLIKQHGRNAIAVYVGNPNVHTLAGQFYLPVVLQALRTQNLFSASTVDQMPKQVSAGLMFGGGLSIPIPDLERTEYLLLLGANPLISNGSLMTAPGMRDRLRSLRQRGGKIVVIDPYRTRTAQEADEHHFIRPGADAHFLFAIVHTLFNEGLVRPGRLSEHINGLEQVRELAQSFAPERVAEVCGIEASAIRRIARELAAAPKAVVYGRVGTCTQSFGTLTSWLVDVINVLTGNLDREGGALFPRAAVGARNASGSGGQGSGIRLGRWKSRVRGLDECFGELPVACLAEEIETPGEGQIRALITLAGNPALSTPNGQRLQHAFETLDYMVSVDMYLNETTRHADVILPPPSALERAHYDVAFYQLAVHNIANYSPPLFDHEAGALNEWEIYLRLAGVLGGQGSAPDLALLDDMAITALIQRQIKTAGFSIEGWNPDELLAALRPRRGPERILDFFLRSGPYGDGFDPQRTGLSLAVLEANPHGVDLGPLSPRIPEVLRTPSGKIELAPQRIVADVERLQTDLTEAREQIVLIGRRDLRSNNSWMHNLNVLVKGPERCTLHMHPEDAARMAFMDGEVVRVTSRVGSVELPVECTDAIMPGIVSIPHGWGHNQSGSRMRIAKEHAGVNTNILSDESELDPLSGNAVLNGIGVVIEKSS
ncbi:MAG: molybdopterin-dependent oxidoreductase [Ktedonobacteraceae bacterium]|nr:molybdopterin-dependent oxidoreductase [Ktedonobacteraceae bacterium]